MISIKWFNKIYEFFKEIFRYLSMPLEEQAVYLENKKKYRLARRKYIYLNNFEKVIHISRILQDYKSVFIYQVKNNQIYEAMQTAELYELYELGAPLCEKQGALIKAANMYAHFNPIKAASLYKQAHLWNKAAKCYLKEKQWIRALDCIEQISSKEEKKKLYDNIEKLGNELYVNKNYEEAIKLYLRINSFEKALKISEEIGDQKTSFILYEKLAQEALNNKNIEKAAKFFEIVNPSKAFTLYLQNQDIDNAVRILISQKKYEEAIHLCLKNEYEEKALKIAQEHKLYDFLLSYFKEKKNYTKISWIYEQLKDFNEAIEYFKQENKLDFVANFAKKLPHPSDTANILKDIKYYEQAAQYYLLDDNVKKCRECLKLAGKTEKEIEKYLFIKNYPA
ncbi:soluble NSF attachment family protein [Defluviitalea phaphyphila]|uniref:hypothetical protein n=1 Tax=Defluviitalea phaphyphila TaxID=1473580 RepID=UPI00073016D7|nr:hypothetical protein [Defluviitalea phaphyphila]